jgi:hypothetical protein
MFKQKLLVQACALALAAPLTAFAASNETCIGNLFEEGMEVPGKNPPTVKITRSVYAPILKAGEGVELGTELTLDGGSPMLFWCVVSKDGSPVGTLEPLADDFSKIKYTAPANIAAEEVLKLIARVGDNQGYANGASMYVRLLAGSSTFTLTGLITDATGKPLPGVTLTVDGKTAVTDADGRYTLDGLALGTYPLTASKDGYTFPPTQITVGADNSNPEINLEASGVSSLAQLAIATRACDGQGNRRVVLFDKAATLIDSFDSGIDKDLRLFTPDWDNNGATDFLLISKILQGNEVLAFDFLGKRQGALTVSRLNQGVNLAFGNALREGGMTALVAGQDGEDTLSLWRTGQPVELLKLLGKPTAFNFAVGDLEGQGEDNLVLALATETGGPNVGVFDKQGKLLRYFTALASTGSATAPSTSSGDGGGKTPGLVVEVLDTNDDGKAEIVVANAEGNRFEVGIYQADGTLIKRFEAFGPIARDARSADKRTICHNGHTISISERAWAAHQAHGDTEGACPLPITGGGDDSPENTQNACPDPRDGLLLTSGDLDKDGKPEIIASRDGGREVRVFSGEGQLLKSFQGTEQEAEAITSLAYGKDMKLDVPVVTDPPPAGEPLDDGEFTGNENNPPDFGDREITGRVRLSYVVIGKLILNIGAKLHVGPGVRFHHARDIPHGLDVSDAFPRIHGGAGHHALPAINLSYNVANDASTLIQNISVVLNGLPVQQSQSTGNVTIIQNAITYIVRPIRVMQAAAGTKPGVHWKKSRGVLAIVTQDGQEVETVPAMQNLADFIQGLFGINLTNLQVDEDGQMRADPVNRPGLYYVGMADISTEEADEAVPLGIVPEESIFFLAGNRMLRTLVFLDEQGHKRRQRVYPRPAYPELLLSQTALGFEVYQDGTLSFTWNGELYQGLLSYGVLSGSFVSASGGVEFYPTYDMNADGVADFEIVYPNGDRQVIYTIAQ